jgi:hypothetical protein
VIRGRCKDTRAKLNANQEAFRDALEAAGGIYIIARSIEDVIREVPKIRAMPKAA